MGDEYLGEFEHLVLLAILRLGDAAHGAPIRRLIEERAERRVSLGAVYSTLRRLEAKGYARAREQPAGSASGGRPRRVFELDRRGQAALEASRRRLDRMRLGLDVGALASRD